MKILYTLLSIFLICNVAFAQNFEAKEINEVSRAYNTHFTNYKLYSINTKSIKSFAKANAAGMINFQIDFPSLETLSFKIVEDDIVSENYKLTVGNLSNRIEYEKPVCMTYEGFIADAPASRVRLTITDDILYGIVKTNTKEYFIEPLHYISQGAPADYFVVYETKDVINDPNLICGVTEAKKEQTRMEESSFTMAGLNCVVTELAIASDNTMFDRYGSAAAVATHNIGVMNNVIWDYVNAQFDNNIEFLIVGQNVSTTPANNQTSPLYNGTNAYTILPNFAAWGQAGNFGFTYDLAQYWTAINIDSDGAGGGSGVVGLAYVGVVCTNSRYQILEDFTGSNPSGSGFNLRVLTTHEIGHNFNCSHDAGGSPFIMAPTVQNTKTWSAASIASADAHVGSRVCLSACSSAGPTRTDFVSSPGVICVGGTFQFTDQTLGGPTSWAWTFPGGTPATSTLRNPTVSFATAGTKSISLTTNNGSGPTSKSKSFLVALSPTVACSNSGTSTSNAGVNSFSLNTINNVTGGAAVDGNKYVDFSCSNTTNLVANTTYSVSVNVGTTNPSNQFNLVQLFIDYTNDGDFLDVNEAVYSSPSCYIGTHTFSFTTPAVIPFPNALLRTRVIAKDCIGGVNACYNVTDGQVEDYSVSFFNALPLKLLSFKGAHRGGINTLNWNTAEERNTKHFEIERSLNKTDFSFAGILPANTITTSNVYQFQDDVRFADANSIFYYRLKMVDIDGRFTYSNVVMLKSEGSLNISFYPNPVKRGQQIKINRGNININSVEIINSIGQVISSKTAATQNSIISINTQSNWPAGSYIIRFKSAQQTYNETIVIL